MLSTSPGISLPSLARIAEYHPRFALAVAEGASVQIDVRILSANFPSTASVGTPIPASYSEPITRYSILAGCEVTVDPTTSFSGNPLKGLNDATMALVTATTFTLLATQPRGQFQPVFDETPLQLIPSLFKPFAGVWAIQGPSGNVKARFTLQSTPNGGVPFTAWLGMSYMVLEGNCIDRDQPIAEVRKALREVHGICCGSAG
jgi:hypothetical protein